MKNSLTKKALLVAIVLIILTSTNVFAYAFFNDFTREDQVNINLGDWLDNSIAISTAQEFYDCVNNINSLTTDYYYLANDIDFENYNWTFSEDIIFRGTIDGNNHVISNLNITTTDTSVKYFGLFPIIEDATIKNIKFDNVHVNINSTTLNRASMRAGLISGRVQGDEVNILNIEISNSSVIGSNSYGTGGLIGQIYGSTSTVNIDSIKANNLKVFSKRANVGGIVGYAYGSSSTLNISNIDIQVELFAGNTRGYIGGIVGKTSSGSNISIENAIVDILSKNTFVDYSSFYNQYSKRFIGGVIGYNFSETLSINNVFITGEMITYSKNYVKTISSLIAREAGSNTVTNVYYSNILFLQADGSTDYSEVTNNRGVKAQVVIANQLPNEIWWNDFYLNFDQTIWSQEESGYLSLTT